VLADIHQPPLYFVELAHLRCTIEGVHSAHEMTGPRPRSWRVKSDLVCRRGPGPPRGGSRGVENRPFNDPKKCLVSKGKMHPDTRHILAVIYYAENGPPGPPWGPGGAIFAPAGRPPIFHANRRPTGRGGKWDAGIGVV